MGNLGSVNYLNYLIIYGKLIIKKKVTSSLMTMKSKQSILNKEKNFLNGLMSATLKLKIKRQIPNEYDIFILYKGRGLTM